MLMLIDTQSESDEYEAILELNVLDAGGFFVPKIARVSSRSAACPHSTSGPPVLLRKRKSRPPLSVTVASRPGGR